MYICRYCHDLMEVRFVGGIKSPYVVNEVGRKKCNICGYNGEELSYFDDYSVKRWEKNIQIAKEKIMEQLKTNISEQKNTVDEPLPNMCYVDHDLIETLKRAMGYTVEKPVQCGQCKYCVMSENPYLDRDFIFTCTFNNISNISVSEHGRCAKFAVKEVKKE